MRKTFRPAKSIFHPFAFHLADTWVWESLAIALSTALMVATIVVLAVFNGQDISTWSFPYNITPNAVIATLNTVSKSLLLFVLSAAVGQWKWIYAARRPLRLKTFGHIDRSSRGPLGSAQVLHQTRFSIISLGAVLILLNLFSDPFIQQVVNFSTQLIPTQDQLVQLPKANNYTSYSESDVQMQETIAAAFAANADVSNSTIQQTDCPTGNCDFDPFETLAVCSQCFDVTSELTKLFVAQPLWANSTIDNVTRLTYYGDLDMTALQYKDILLINPTVDSLVEDEHNVTVTLETGPFSWSYATWNFTTSDRPPDYTDFPNGSAQIVQISSINITDFMSVLDWPNSAVDAKNCSLYFCIQNIQSTIRNGTLTESVQTVSATMPVMTSIEALMYDTNSPPQQYSVDQASLERIWDDLFLNWFQGQESNTQQEHAIGYLPSTGWGANTTIYADFFGIDTAASRVTWSSSNLSSTFEAFAKAMTQTVRRNTAGTSSVSGTVLRQATLIRVRWPWLILPLFTTVGGVVFLVLTIIATKRAKVPLWKEDVLATLMHGLESAVDVQSVNRLGSGAAMGEYAKYTNVRLHESEKGRMGLATERGYYFPIMQMGESEESMLGDSDGKVGRKVKRKPVK